MRPSRLRLGAAPHAQQARAGDERQERHGRHERQRARGLRHRRASGRIRVRVGRRFRRRRRRRARAAGRRRRGRHLALRRSRGSGLGRIARLRDRQCCRHQGERGEERGENALHGSFLCERVDGRDPGRCRLTAGSIKAIASTSGTQFVTHLTGLQQDPFPCHSLFDLSYEMSRTSQQEAQPNKEHVLPAHI
jgi:hypothetical protein